MEKSRPRPVPRLSIIFCLLPSQHHDLEPEPPPIYVNEFEKIEIPKNRPIPETIQHECHDSLINHIPKSMKRSESNTKQDILRLSESKLDNSTQQTLNQKN